MNLMIAARLRFVASTHALLLSLSSNSSSSSRFARRKNPPYT